MGGYRFSTWVHTLARAAVWASIAIAITILAYASFRLLQGGSKPLFGAYDPAELAGLGSVKSDRRMIRHGQINGVKVICIEPAFARRASMEKVDTSGHRTDREDQGPSAQQVAWQLCNAYLNGVISKDQYAAALMPRLGNRATAEPSGKSLPPQKHPVTRTLKRKCNCNRHAIPQPDQAATTLNAAS